MDEDSSYDSLEEKSLKEHIEGLTYEQYIKEEMIVCLEDWIDVSHERKREIEDFFHMFQINISLDLGAEISKKIIPLFV